MLCVNYLADWERGGPATHPPALQGGFPMRRTAAMAMFTAPTPPDKPTI